MLASEAEIRRSHGGKSMYRVVAVLFALSVCTAAPVEAEPCTSSVYEGLVQEAKSADSSREWNRSVELHQKILEECREQIPEKDLPKVHDALSVGLLMQGNYAAAIDEAKLCLQQDEKYNACMMTAAKGYENLGDREMAIKYAEQAVETGNADEYSAAVTIYAREFLRGLGK